jgi:hypothetical protein
MGHGQPWRSSNGFDGGPSIHASQRQGGGPTSRLGAESFFGHREGFFAALAAGDQPLDVLDADLSRPCGKGRFERAFRPYPSTRSPGIHALRATERATESLG